MHVGVKDGPDSARPFAIMGNGEPDGAISADGRVMGSYCHGLLSSKPFRKALLGRFGIASSETDHSHSIDSALDDIAAGPGVE